MVIKTTNDRPDSNFRQQDSTARKLENEFDAPVQKQFATTATIVKDNENQQTTKDKLQKQHTNQAINPVNELRQQESTPSKIGKTLGTGEQQFSQSSSVVNNSSGNNSNFVNSNPINNKLQKNFSNQIREEFRPKETTSSQQFTQSSLKEKEYKLHNKPEKASPSTINDSFKKGAQKYQEELEKGDLGVAVGSQLAKQTVKVPTKVIKKLKGVWSSDSVATQANGNPSSNNNHKGSRLKRIIKKPVKVLKNGVKKGAVSYQKELEKEDLGVKIGSQGITKTVKGSTTTVRKLRGKWSESTIRKKIKAKLTGQSITPTPPPVKKVKGKILKRVVKKPFKVLKSGVKKGAVSYKKELEKEDLGVKIAIQGTTQASRSAKKLKKGVSKVSGKLGKLAKKGTKLKRLRLKQSTGIKKTSMSALQKKAIKKKLYYAPKSKRKAVVGTVNSFSNRMINMFKSTAQFNRMIVSKMLGAKVVAGLGSGLVAVLPIIAVAAFILVILGVTGGSSVPNQPSVGSKNLSPEVEQWRSLVEQEAAAQGMEAYVNLLLAIIQVESGGTGTPDIMQSSESAGYPRNYWSTEEESVRQGVKHLKNIVNIVKPHGLENNYKLLAQAYNFGSYFATYAASLGGDYTLDVAEQYSRDVVAPSLGNTTGLTYPYVNDTSVRLGKTYLYRDGGNFMYGELVSEYLGGHGGSISGDFAIVVAELEKYLGWPYKWGGKSPSTSFDCSGFTSWGLKQIGINLPSYAASQYQLTVAIDPSEAQPGDLIFFKGTYGNDPNHISHVGFYIDENTMLDSNSSGIGYHSWKDSYWQKHYAGIRRVVKN